MRVLVDASFPQTVVGPHAGGAHTIERYRGGPIPDRALVDYAHGGRYDVLVFMGPTALAEDQVLEAARALALPVAATITTEPQQAAGVLTNNLTPLSTAIKGQGILVIRADGVRPSERPSR